MFRDGARKSMWQAEIKRNGTVFSADLKYDVVIIGGGITGASTAHRLQLKGSNCLLLEARNLGFGTSGDTTAHLNDFFDTTFKEAIDKFGPDNACLLADAGKEAMRIFRSNVTQHSIECDFEEKTAELFAVDEDQMGQMEDIVDGAREIGYQMHYTDRIDFPISFSKAVRIPGQAQFHPIKYIRALADIYREWRICRRELPLRIL
jgi:glycine/D-amino acid oxidase-like deaminating enzyme